MHKCNFWLLQENLTEFEDQVVTLCQKLTCEDWTTDEGVANQSGTTLLHLSSSLGMTRLTCSLLHWAAESPGRRLCKEVDAMSLDNDGYNPLVSFYHDSLSTDSINNIQVILFWMYMAVMTCKPFHIVCKKDTMAHGSCLMYLMSVNTEAQNKWIIIPLLFLTKSYWANSSSAP